MFGNVEKTKFLEKKYHPFYCHFFEMCVPTCRNSSFNTTKRNLIWSAYKKHSSIWNRSDRQRIRKSVNGYILLYFIRASYT